MASVTSPLRDGYGQTLGKTGLGTQVALTKYQGCKPIGDPIERNVSHTYFFTGIL